MSDLGFEHNRGVGRGWLRFGIVSAASVGLPVLGLALVSGALAGRMASPAAAPLWSAPVAMVLIALGAGFALTPTHLTSLLSGYLFGLGVGLTTAMVGVLGATWVGYGLACRLDGDRLRTLVERRPLGRALSEAMLAGDGRRATAALALARLPPQVPFALGNVLAASLGAPRRALLVGTAVGMAPRVGLVVWVGAALSRWEPGAAPPGAVWLAVGGGVIGLGGLGIWAGLRIRAFSRRAAVEAR